MAKIVGCVAASHAPQLFIEPEDWIKLPARTKRPLKVPPNIEQAVSESGRRQNWERCHRAITTLREMVSSWKADVVIVLGDDQHENFLDDNMPGFAVFIEDEVKVTRKVTFYGEKATDQSVPYKVRGDLAKDLLKHLMASDFDPAWSRSTRYEAGLGHAFGRVLHLVMPDTKTPILPVMVNTYYPPAPSARRCMAFGKAIRAAIERWPATMRVGIVASGGLTHTRVDEDLDHEIISALERYDEAYLSSFPDEELVEGTSEIRNWFIAAGIVAAPAKAVDYVACYRSKEGAGCGMGFAYWPIAI